MDRKPQECLCYFFAKDFACTTRAAHTELHALTPICFMRSCLTAQKDGEPGNKASMYGANLSSGPSDGSIILQNFLRVADSTARSTLVIISSNPVPWSADIGIAPSVPTDCGSLVKRNDIIAQIGTVMILINGVLISDRIE